MVSKVLLTIALLFTLTLTAFSNDRSEGYNVGDQVSDFVIANYDGSQYSMAENGAKATVIIFVSTECPFVQPYTERLINLQNEFGDKGVTIWAINSNNTESTDEVMNHAKEKGYNFPVLKDQESVVATQFGASRTPEVFLIDNSSMTVMYHGRIDDNKNASDVTSNDLQNAINDFLAGNAIAVNETKAFGCSIKK
ncbi:MAG TPA: thioredoxin family protein [Ignavibacteria bacterium]|nr:thioredoxin family protein [Ignavibacteria bacterium]HMR39351.1 thioredoxin family protein [Ignavibacteria bacterium]